MAFLNAAHFASHAVPASRATHSSRPIIGTLSGHPQDMSQQSGPVRALDALWVLLTTTLLVLAVVYLIQRV